MTPEEGRAGVQHSDSLLWESAVSLITTTAVGTGDTDVVTAASNMVPYERLTEHQQQLFCAASHNISMALSMVVMEIVKHQCGKD